MSEAEVLRMIDCDPATMPLDEMDVSQLELWSENAKWDFFKRLRDEAPVHLSLIHISEPTRRS